MREIKFRAWNKVHRTMYCTGKFALSLEGKLFVGENNPDAVWQYRKLPELPTCLCSKDVEIMQFTGLKDKNGKEIYKGDISSGQYWKEGGETSYGVVQWCKKDALFEIEWISGDTYGAADVMDVASNFEVIGNICENPELTKDMP